jgi:regulator of telomere elongation helicase 1
MKRTKRTKKNYDILKTKDDEEYESLQITNKKKSKKYDSSNETIDKYKSIIRLFSYIIAGLLVLIIFLCFSKGSKEEKQMRQPVIFYTSRTHAQITNVIKELKKTVYRPINAVISSREQSCVNEYLSNFSGGILNLKCKYATKKGECKYFKGKSLQGKGWSAYDGLTVDELKEKGKKYKFCPYQFEKDKSKYSDIIFLPYNYIFDMKILVKTKLILNNSILIIDEAHNLQDVCCDSSSCDINTNILDEIIVDLKALKSYLEEFENLKIGPTTTTGLMASEIKTTYLSYEISILSIIKERIMNIKINYKNVGKMQNPGVKLSPEEFFNLLFKKYKASQTTLQFGDNKKDEEEIHNNNLEQTDSDGEIKPELTPTNITKHISFLKNVEYFINNDRGKGTLISAYTDFLEIIHLLIANYYDKEAKKDPLNLYVNSFRFYLEEIKEQDKKASTNKKKKTITFSNSNSKVIKRCIYIYCFNPGFGFKNVLNKILYSIIITSGTLSPIDSMESELKQNFDTKLENNHVISDEQFHFCLLTSSVYNKMEFNFNADNRYNVEMIYQLGLTILELSKITPGGILIFFGSYTLMDRYISEWSDKSIISEISKYKEFYHDRRDQKQNKLILSKYQLANSDRTKYKGGILLSVCRGSCSEGMNFKNDMARLVIVVGIPYAMLYDPKIQLKKEFQDDYNKLLSKNAKNSKIRRISGSEWYTQNAMKCVNQSLGRVIRHSNDYGSMLLIDTRYQNFLRQSYISLWMRKKCKIYNNENLNKTFFKDMENFFKNAEDFIKNKKAKINLSQKNNILSSDKRNENSAKSKNSKNAKILIEKMNEIEKMSKTEKNEENAFICNSKKRNIYEVRIGGNGNVNKEESQKNENDTNFEDIKHINEAFFENLMETPNSKENINDNKKRELSDKELINELIKKKNNKKFIEELEKKGLEVQNNHNDSEPQNKNKLSCRVCFSDTNDSKIKFEIGKCGHPLCQFCWSKIENKKGISKCPVCRQEVKREERNQIFL